jgi:hypothetical protein
MFSLAKEGIRGVFRRLPFCDRFAATRNFAFKQRDAIGEIGLGHGVQIGTEKNFGGFLPDGQFVGIDGHGFRPQAPLAIVRSDCSLTRGSRTSSPFEKR